MNAAKIMYGKKEIKGIASSSLPKLEEDEITFGDIKSYFGGQFRTGSILTAEPKDYDALWGAANTWGLEVGDSLVIEGTYKGKEEQMKLKCIEKNQKGYKFEVIF